MGSQCKPVWAWHSSAPACFLNWLHLVDELESLETLKHVCYNFLITLIKQIKKAWKKRNANLGLFSWFLDNFEPIWVAKMIKNISFCYNPCTSMFPQANNTLKQICFWFLRRLIIFSHFVQSSFTIADTQSYHNNLFKQGNLTAQSVTENFKWKFCDHNFQKKNGWSIIKKSIGKVLVYVGVLN